MAAQASMDISTFHRHMRTKVGVSPMGWLNRQRVSTARGLLEGTDLSVDEIVERTGLGTSANLRLHFRGAKLAMSPTCDCVFAQDMTFGAFRGHRSRVGGAFSG